jgi:hypothetical protein
VKTLIFLASLNLPPSTDFLKPPFTHMDALTLPERSLRQDLSGFYDVTSAILTAVVSPAPPHLRSVPISLANTSTVRIHATAQLLFLVNDFFKKCCEKLWEDDRHIAFRGKTTAWSGVRPSERPAGLGLFSSTFFSFDRSLSRCGAQTSFFLHTNSLVNSSHVGDAFKRMVAWDFAVFQKVKLGSIFSKVPTVEDPLWTAGVLIVSRSEFFMFNPIVQGRYLFSCCVVL